MNCEGGDGVIIAVLNRVRLYACIFNPMKFGEDWMKNKGVIVFTSKSTQTDRRTDRQTDGQTDGQTDITITIPLLPRGKN